MNVHLGVGPGGYKVLHFWDYHSETCCWEYEAELMSIYWYTNHYDVAYGFKARITRIGWIGKKLYLEALNINGQ